MTFKSVIFGPYDGPYQEPALRITERDTDMVRVVRSAWTSHQDITTLPALRFYAADGWDDVAEAWAVHMRTLYDELGNSVLDAWEGVEAATKNAFNFREAPTHADFVGRHQNTPAICIGAGPSAGLYLEWVRESLPGAVVFCCDAMTGALRDMGIKPDYVTTVERPNAIQAVHEPGEGWTVIANTTSNPGAVGRYSDAIFWVTRDAVNDWCVGDGVQRLNPCLSSGTMSICAAMVAMCSPIYLVGHDLAFGPDGQTHTDAAAAAAPESQRRAMERGGQQLADQCLERDGVRTTYLWDRFARNIELWLSLWGEPEVYRIGNAPALPLRGVGALPSPPKLSDPVQKPKIMRKSAVKGVSIADLEAAATALTAVGHDSMATAMSLYNDQISVDLAAKSLLLARILGDSPAKQVCAYLLQPIYSAMHCRVHAGRDMQQTVARLGLAVGRHAFQMADAMRRLAAEVEGFSDER